VDAVGMTTLDVLHFVMNALSNLSFPSSALGTYF